MSSERKQALDKFTSEAIEMLSGALSSNNNYKSSLTGAQPSLAAVSEAKASVR